MTVNPLLKKIHGKIGGLVFKKYGSGTIIAQTPGPRTTPPTPGQQAQQERFKLAAVYGHTALADPVTGALYRARAEAKGQPVFSVAVSDFFNEPVVDKIDLSSYTGKIGEIIWVRASDDIGVVGVGVAIRDTDSKVLGSKARPRRPATELGPTRQPRTCPPGSKWSSKSRPRIAPATKRPRSSRRADEQSGKRKCGKQT